MSKKICFCLMGISLLVPAILTGCGGGHAASDLFRGNGLPDARFRVGGGVSIDWVAPQDGTIYVVEETTRKTLVTKTVKAGETYTLSLGDHPDEVESLIGIKLGSAKFSLYFIPAPVAPAVQGRTP